MTNKVQTITAYKTSDGKIWTDETIACKEQANINFYSELIKLLMSANYREPTTAFLQAYSKEVYKLLGDYIAETQASNKDTDI